MHLVSKLQRRKLAPPSGSFTSASNAIGAASGTAIGGRAAIAGAGIGAGRAGSGRPGQCFDQLAEFAGIAHAFGLAKAALFRQLMVNAALRVSLGSGPRGYGVLERRGLSVAAS